ncbi:MAG: response regulator [Desulfobacteraceae bacterium]|nr:response regulator [Desulfobacteraceae bacterium]
MARRILIVDRSATMRRIIRGMILANVNDAEVAEAADAADAWQQLADEDFHLMLFSWEPSGAAWLDFLKRLREKEGDRQTAAILLTSSAKRPYVREAVTAGVAEYLVTPFTPAELTGLMNRVCNPVTLRHSRRYSLPDTTALVQQEQKSFQAAVVNISEGGVLCELDYAADYKWTAPAMVSITFRIEGEQITAEDLFALPNRCSIVESNPDFTPRKMKVAYRFFNVPPSAKQVLETVFNMAEIQEKILSSKRK